VENIETIRVTRAFGRIPGNLEMIWFLRDQAERRLREHCDGVHLTADEWAAINTPDEAYNDPDMKINPEWKKFKDEWFEEMGLLAALAMAARRHVRIATGHEPIGKMVCR